MGLLKKRWQGVLEFQVRVLGKWRLISEEIPFLQLVSNQNCSSRDYFFSLVSEDENLDKLNALVKSTRDMWNKNKPKDTDNMIEMMFLTKADQGYISNNQIENI